MEIFKRVPGEDPIKIEVAENLDIGLCRMVELSIAVAGSYFVYDSNESRIVAAVSLNLPPKQCTPIAKPNREAA